MLDSAFFQQQTPPKSATRWVVGFSGGLDSTALLHLCIAYRNQYNPNLDLLALHVNHGLAATADQWQQQCQQFCQQHQVNFLAESVAIRAENRTSVEQIARRERYGVFRRHCTANDLLLLAHHLDDQIETLLYRLVRGSGTLGLRGMEPLIEDKGLSIWRPLLGVSRQELANYVQAQSFQWIEDPSNQNQTFDRNFIRHQIIPLLESRWPGVRKTLARSSRLAAESTVLANDLARMDLNHCRQGQQLGIQALAQLSLPRLRNLLRYWLGHCGATLPSEKVLHQIQQAVLNYHPEQDTLISWAAERASQKARWQVRTFQGLLWAIPEPEPIPAGWQGMLTDQLPLVLPGGLGKLELKPVDSAANNSSRCVFLAAGSLRQPISIRFRQGGETFKPAGCKGKPLKKWFHDWKVPPWLRSRIPLIYVGSELAAVMGYGVSGEFSVAPGGSGIEIRLISASA